MDSKTKQIEKLIKKLSDYKGSNTVTNLYRGKSTNSQMRRENLGLYFKKMIELNPSFLLLGEAPGYKGCRLTGIPFSSERIVANNKSRCYI